MTTGGAAPGGLAWRMMISAKLARTGLGKHGSATGLLMVAQPEPGLTDPIGADRAGRVVAECLAIGLGGPTQS